MSGFREGPACHSLALQSVGSHVRLAFIGGRTCGEPFRTIVVVYGSRQGWHSSDVGNKTKGRQMNRKTDKLFRVLGLAAIIFLLAVLAINFLRSRKMTAMEACIANMRQLEGAREQALLAGQNASIKGSVTPATATVPAVYGPVAPPKPFDCPSPAGPADTEFQHSLYK